MMAFDWTEPRIEKLRIMWRNGVSASRIAKALGNPSRNSVIGKASRMGLPGRDSPIQRGRAPGVRKPYDRKAHVRNPRGPYECRADTVAKQQDTAARREAKEREMAERLRLAELEAIQRREADRRRAERILARAAASDRHRCAYPIGDPKAADFHFCEDQVKPGSSYCPEHHAICWVAPPVLKPREAA